MESRAVPAGDAALVAVVPVVEDPPNNIIKCTPPRAEAGQPTLEQSLKIRREFLAWPHWLARSRSFS
jgi:hypothetical protein